MAKSAPKKKGVQVVGLEQLVAKFDRKGSRPVVKCTIGFRASYATIVHERLDVIHPRGQAKYLSRAVEETKYQLEQMAPEVMAKNLNISQTKYLVATLNDLGAVILKRAKELVPVRTGFLRASGYVHVEQG